MCGRYSLHADPNIVALYFKLGVLPELQPRYNIAPEQGGPPERYVPIVRVDKDGEREMPLVQWWLLPFWSKEPRIKYSTFNAKVETVTTAASFREPLKRRRCLIPASGWYEWTGPRSARVPWYIESTTGPVVALAGLWDHWEKDGQVIESCSIIVGESNNTIRRIHDRSPIVLFPQAHEAWLDPDIRDPEKVMKLLQSVPDDAVRIRRVGMRVNRAGPEGADLLDPVAET